jgi:serine/threonine protein kinase
MMGHERAQAINKIRSPDIGFPPSWPTGREKQHQLINWLLAHDPSSRPSADTVLASPLMPIELKTPAELSKAIASTYLVRSLLTIQI